MKTKRAKTKVRYAVVGAGHIAQVAVLPAFEHASENSELVAILSGNEAKRHELGRLHKVKFTGAYEELEVVLRDSQADAAYLAVPNSLHRELTERCARAGVHVLCEKPMAMDEEDCEAMIAVTEEHGVKLMIAYRLHFEETNLRAIEIVHSGLIGEARIFDSIFSQQVRLGDIRTQRELGGGALFDLGLYCVNAARYLFRAEPLQVFAFRTTGTEERFRDVDEMTSVVLRFPEGRLAQFTASQGAADVSTVRIVGTKGDLRLEPAFDYSRELQHHLTIDGKLVERTFSSRDQFAAEFIYFSRCIIEDLPPEPSGEEGLADVRVLRAIERSAATGQLITLGPFPRAQRPDMSQNIHKPPVKEQKTIHAPSPSMK